MNRQSDGTSFHMENFKRRSRYTLVFVLLILAFGLITVLNINTGNVHISLSEIVNILLKKATDTKEYSIIWQPSLEVHYLYLVFFFRPFLKIPLQDLLFWEFPPVPKW